MFAAMEFIYLFIIIFSLATQERVQNSRGQRAICVRATEVLLYLKLICVLQFVFPSGRGKEVLSLKASAVRYFFSVNYNQLT